MGGGRNGCFLGRPDFASFVENALFSRVLAKNRGAPKTAVPTTTHPVPHLDALPLTHTHTTKKLETSVPKLVATIHFLLRSHAVSAGYGAFIHELFPQRERRIHRFTLMFTIHSLIHGRIGSLITPIIGGLQDCSVPGVC